MKRIKTDNGLIMIQLSTEMLYNLLTISQERQELPNFNSNKAVTKFFDKKRQHATIEPDEKGVRLEPPIQ